MVHISNILLLKIIGKLIQLNYMVQYGAMFIIEMAFASRGRERMDFYTKDDFQILMDEDNNFKILEVNECR